MIIASFRLGISKADGQVSNIALLILLESSFLGLSSVIITASAKFSAISPMIGLLNLSLPPPQPKTRVILFSVSSLRENKAAVNASGV